MEVYVNMGRIIKDTVKSTSFPPVKNITTPFFINKEGFAKALDWEEWTDDNWEVQSYIVDWDDDILYRSTLAELSSADSNLMRKWDDRDVSWDAKEFAAQELEWNEDRGYTYGTQDTRRKFSFDPESLRVR